VVTDALGNPLAFRVTAGQRHEITQAEPLLQQCLLSDAQRAEVQAVLGDKAFDSDAFVAHIVSLEAQAVIPSRKGRKEPRAYDGELYKERNKVERFFNRIKHYRRVATRYEKAVRNYESFLHVACIMTWLL
jgi:transposase